jgi:hypothetical protein
MTLIRPRLNDFYDLPFTQEEVDFAIPFLDEDIPLFVDPFLLWKSPSLQDQSLHTALLSSFNYLGVVYKEGKLDSAINGLINISECIEVGLGMASNKIGHRIGEDKAREILSLFSLIPQIERGGFKHIEELQLLIDQFSKDRISDITCNLLKSFLIDFTIDQCIKLNIPVINVELQNVFNYQKREFMNETVSIPFNPLTGIPILFVPKRWLRYIPWINYENYFSESFITDKLLALGITERVEILNYNRQNYDLLQSYIAQKERTHIDCKNDPLFNPIPIISAKRKFAQILKLPSGKTDSADRKFEDLISQLIASLLYPHLDFADEQSRTDSGVLIRDLIFYNNRSMDFLNDIYSDYGSRQIVVELKNVAIIEREHINQLNRYLNEQFGRFGIIITRNPLPKAMFKNTIDLWSGQRKCIIVLTDNDISIMVNLFENGQRLPIEVIKRAYIQFIRSCPS